MQDISIQNLIELATQYSMENVDWHHHFLALECHFNKSGKYQIILENEMSKELFVCYFDEKPTDHLEKLENIFFKRS